MTGDYNSLVRVPVDFYFYVQHDGQAEEFITNELKKTNLKNFQFIKCSQKECCHRRTKD